MNKQLFVTTILATVALGVALFAAPVFAQDFGLGATAGAAGLKSNASVPTLIGNIIGTALSMIAVIFFILMVYGGFLWMTAHGNNDQVKKAQDTIIAAVIGIIIVLGSYAITNFVFSSVEGGNNAPNNPNAPQAQQDPNAPVISCGEGSVDICQNQDIGFNCQQDNGEPGTCQIFGQGPNCFCN